jgi:hypothetical protein
VHFKPTVFYLKNIHDLLLPGPVLEGGKNHRLSKPESLGYPAALVDCRGPTRGGFWWTCTGVRGQNEASQ